MKVTKTEPVELFFDESSEPVGMLLLNGHARFFKLVPASKDFVREELLEVAPSEPRKVQFVEGEGIVIKPEIIWSKKSKKQ